MLTHDAMMGRYDGLTPAVRKEREVYAVSAGANVYFSSSCNSDHEKYMLDHANGYSGWAAKQCIVGEWIQVSQENPRLWTGVIMQGRGDGDQWVKSIKMAYTVNGKEWESLQNGHIFEANSDRNTKMRITFSHPIYARALRIYPQTWNAHLSMRFDAIYLDL